MKTEKFKLLLLGAVLLLFAGGISSCSKKHDAAPVVSKIALTAEIATATTLHDGATEGVAEGNYLKGSKASLQTAITAAQGVVDSPTSTQAQVTAALATLTAAVATFNGQLVTPIDPDNLSGQWTFDEIASATVGATVKDYSGNNHDGVIKVGHEHWGGGTPTLVADRYGDAGKALHFDEGANVEIPYATDLNPPTMSISVWAKPDVKDPIYANNYFISLNRWNGYKFQFQDTPRAFFTATIDDPAIPVTSFCCYNRDQNFGTSPLGEWHQYVVTFGGGHEIFYIDGAAVPQGDWNDVPGTISSIAANPVNLVFGQDLPTDGYSLDSDDPNFLDYGAYYIGALDEVRIYKTVLTAAQVAAIYNVEKP